MSFRPQFDGRNYTFLPRVRTKHTLCAIFSSNVISVEWKVGPCCSFPWKSLFESVCLLCSALCCVPCVLAWRRERVGRRCRKCVLGSLYFQICLRWNPCDLFYPTNGYWELYILGGHITWGPLQSGLSGYVCECVSCHWWPCHQWIYWQWLHFAYLWSHTLHGMCACEAFMWSIQKWHLKKRWEEKSIKYHAKQLTDTFSPSRFLYIDPSIEHWTWVRTVPVSKWLVQWEKGGCSVESFLSFFPLSPFTWAKDGEKRHRCGRRGRRRMARSNLRRKEGQRKRRKNSCGGFARSNDSPYSSLHVPCAECYVIQSRYFSLSYNPSKRRHEELEWVLLLVSCVFSPYPLLPRWLLVPSLLKMCPMCPMWREKVDAASRAHLGCCISHGLVCLFCFLASC